MRISTREESVGWDFRKDFCACRAVMGSWEISAVVAEGRVRIGLFVEGEMVVIVSVEGDEDGLVSPLAGMVEVLSCVILRVGWRFLLMMMDEYGKTR